jgi:hypothetical protein
MLCDVAMTVFFCSMLWWLVTANIVHSSPILVTLMMEVYISPKHRFLQEPHGIASQKMAFFMPLAGCHEHVNVDTLDRNCAATNMHLLIKIVTYSAGFLCLCLLIYLYLGLYTTV